MVFMHPELRTGLAEEHILRLEGDMRTRRSAGRTRRLAARLLLSASERLAGESRQASSASLTSLSANSLCSRRTAV
jgi:hypothetical protein